MIYNGTEEAAPGDFIITEFQVFKYLIHIIVIEFSWNI